MTELLVNGEIKKIGPVDAEMPLVFVLRDILDLKGTKYGCLEGICGACTVLIDGAAMRACQITTADVIGSRITTIEGLSKKADHPVQQAWLQERVAQCGYCQSGQIMQAAAFLSETPKPSTDEIKDAMADNLCRCGTAPRIVRAVARAAAANAGGA